MGDRFTLDVLNETFTYEVDQILVTLPEETEELYIQNGKDLVTLYTCTPYGVNTHRLHVNLCRKKRRFHFFVNRRIFSIILPVLLPGVRGQGACGYLPHTEYRYKASQGLFRSGHKVLPSLPEVLRGSDPPHT